MRVLCDVGTDLAYAATNLFAVCGTDLSYDAMYMAYGAMRCVGPTRSTVLASRMVLRGVWYWIAYADAPCGTELAHFRQQCGTEIVYGAM
eukprot:92922-Rhodomonas_salina.1